ncbi:MAG TPA: hypothetical protein P5123_12940 [Spirochaetota bacterium]|nr:hypothetical protein [Spirochaetota bacterium]
MPENTQNTIRFENKDVSVLGKAKDYTDKKISTINLFMSVVLVVLVLGFIQLIVDSFRFSSVTYKEYSEKTEMVESINNINKELLEQNKSNQQLIIDQQENILRLIKNK